MRQFITLTKHAKHRSLRRFGITEDKLIELAQKAIMEGYSTGDAPSKQIKRYLESKIEEDRKVYVYSGYVFIFSGDLVLITTYRMPRKHLMSIPNRKV